MTGNDPTQTEAGRVVSTSPGRYRYTSQVGYSAGADQRIQLSCLIAVLLSGVLPNAYRLVRKN